jgi:hypothetical protein
VEYPQAPPPETPELAPGEVLFAANTRPTEPPGPRGKDRRHDPFSIDVRRRD